MNGTVWDDFFSFSKQKNLKIHFIFDENEFPFSVELNDEINEIIIENNKDIEFFMEEKIYEYAYIKNYNAIHCKENNYFEASIVFNNWELFLRSQVNDQQIFLGAEKFSKENDFSVHIDGCSNIEISNPSKIYKFMVSDFSIATIKIKNEKKLNIEKIFDLINNISFQFDVIFNSSFCLEKPKEFKWFALTSKQKMRARKPTFFYDRRAISLYLYACSSSSFPLTQFLAFYQSIEVFFPKFTHEEIRNRMSSVLKSPDFQPDDNSDLDRLMAVVTGKKNGGFLDEKDQLKTVLSACISEDEIRKIIKEENLIEYYENKKTWEKFPKIPVKGKESLIPSICDRIYRIRCAIVHTKFSETGNNTILPFSDDETNIIKDISLLKKIAQQILIYTSRHHSS